MYNTEEIVYILSELSNLNITTNRTLLDGGRPWTIMFEVILLFNYH